MQSLRKITVSVALVFSVFAMPSEGALTAEQTEDTKSFLISIKKTLYPSWDTSAEDYCTWPGVTCDPNTGYATVDLSGKGLSGYAPDANSNNIMIESLDLSGNSGIIGAFKDNWAAMKVLKHLKLSGTGFTRDIPSGWNGMTALVSVDVSNTKACYSLPSWSGLQNLESIDVSNNKLDGAFGGNGWESNPKLTSVNIAGNNFCGCAPTAWKDSAVLSQAVTAGGYSFGPNGCKQCGKPTCPGNGSSITSTSTVAAVSVLAAVVTLLL
ncbi:surface antigen-like protein [Angomonas deanei]|uniref:Leucine rich repeat N-terminal domain/Leucine Rich repeat, putative n=1 Tax=Angomonas deanei TaxID=59799 RepID=A0A7G2CKL9_9TRYP|nr:surface antigen-like protein [Angomonas deanei]CAD2220418.1 Leucine rich repeat N-terminal domain/Leucine Rich repeat, putative [Angomonas deanei]|eukprot:EPY20737.1 surface antigen-like protein [Angomonas deanei]